MVYIQGGKWNSKYEWGINSGQKKRAFWDYDVKKKCGKERQDFNTRCAVETEDKFIEATILCALEVKDGKFVKSEYFHRLSVEQRLGLWETEREKEWTKAKEQGKGKRKGSEPKRMPKQRGRFGSTTASQSGTRAWF